MRAAWFHPFSGIAGDMALGSLIDAGADLDEVRAMLATLEVPGWELGTEDVLRGGIGGTKAHVHLVASTVVRTAALIDALIAQAALPARVADRARSVFAALARAEGHLHRTEVTQVHFHEVGALDAIVDVVGTCAALESLGVDVVASAPVVTGTGMVRAAHGIIPNPSPAVVELLADAPTHGVNETAELTTPTGAAILAALATSWGPMPAMRIAGHGFGAGSRELEGRPNLTQVVIGDLEDTALDTGQPVVLLETNLDDVTGEVLAHAVAALLEAGAHDAWMSPVVMKKGRPGHVLHALADVAVADGVRRVMVAETGSLGVRGQHLERWPEPRRTDVVATDEGDVHVKVGPRSVKVEYDDAVRVASRRRTPLREVRAQLEAAWRDRPDLESPADPETDGHTHKHTHSPNSHRHQDRWHTEGPAEPTD